MDNKGLNNESPQQKLIVESNSAKFTQKIGGVIARAADRIINNEQDKLKGAVKVFLSGELGAGKTSLVQGVMAELAPEVRVTSPTYTFINEFSLATYTVYHVDLYRLESEAELEYLGLYDLLTEECLILVEWPELILSEALDYLKIEFSKTGAEKRSLSFSARGEKSQQLLKEIKKDEFIRD